jgi:hypothetical protein
MIRMSAERLRAAHRNQKYKADVNTLCGNPPAQKGLLARGILLLVAQPPMLVKFHPPGMV